MPRPEFHAIHAKPRPYDPSYHASSPFHCIDDMGAWWWSIGRIITVHVDFSVVGVWCCMVYRSILYPLKGPARSAKLSYVVVSCWLIRIGHAFAPICGTMCLKLAAISCFQDLFCHVSRCVATHTHGIKTSPFVPWLCIVCSMRWYHWLDIVVQVDR